MNFSICLDGACCITSKVNSLPQSNRYVVLEEEEALMLKDADGTRDDSREGRNSRVVASNG